MKDDFDSEFSYEARQLQLKRELDNNVHSEHSADATVLALDYIDPFDDSFSLLDLNGDEVNYEDFAPMSCSYRGIRYDAWDSLVVTYIDRIIALTSDANVRHAIQLVSEHSRINDRIIAEYLTYLINSQSNFIEYMPLIECLGIKTVPEPRDANRCFKMKFRQRSSDVASDDRVPVEGYHYYVNDEETWRSILSEVILFKTADTGLTEAAILEHLRDHPNRLNCGPIFKKRIMLEYGISTNADDPNPSLSSSPFEGASTLSDTLSSIASRLERQETSIDKLVTIVEDLQSELRDMRGQLYRIEHTLHIDSSDDRDDLYNLY